MNETTNEETAENVAAADVVQEAVSEKSRRTYQCLALFLGSIGVHNFYAGRKKFAIVQLSLTVLQAIICAICDKELYAVAGLWALVEIFTVKKDGKGLPFATKAKKEKGNGKSNIGGCLGICFLILLVGSCISHFCSDDKDDASESAKVTAKGNGVPYCKDVSMEPIAKVCYGYLKPEKDVLYMTSELKVSQVVKKDGDLGYYLCELRKYGFGDCGEDRSVLVVSAGGYADGDILSLNAGRYCLCQGTWTYESVLGASKTVYVFVQIKDDAIAGKMIEEVKKRWEEKRRMNQISRKMRDGADDGTSPRVMEVCGLRFGASPLSNVKTDNGSQTIELKGSHKFPPFAKAELHYTKKNRLQWIRLFSSPAPKRKVDEQKQIMSETKELLENKLGIVLNEGVENIYGVMGYFGTVTKDGSVINEFELLSVNKNEVYFHIRDKEIANQDNL